MNSLPQFLNTLYEKMTAGLWFLGSKRTFGASLTAFLAVDTWQYVMLFITSSQLTVTICSVQHHIQHPLN